MATKPKKDQLARYCELKERKRSLESEARSLDTEIDQLADVIMSYLDDLERDTAKVHGYQIQVTDGRAYVSWKDEFVRVSGGDAAAVIAAAAPRSPKLTVTPP
jgi:hypothetical protein